MVKAVISAAFFKSLPREYRLVQPLWKAVWRHLKKLRMDLPFDPETPLLEVYLREPKILIRKNITSPMLIAVLFTITKIWKQHIYGSSR